MSCLAGWQLGNANANASGLANENTNANTVHIPSNSYIYRSDSLAGPGSSGLIVLGIRLTLSMTRTRTIVGYLLMPSLIPPTSDQDSDCFSHVWTNCQKIGQWVRRSSRLGLLLSSIVFSLWIYLFTYYSFRILNSNCESWMNPEPWFMIHDASWCRTRIMLTKTTLNSITE